MKIVSITGFFLLILCFLVVPLKAQDSITHHKNFVGISLSQLPFVDFRISYERRFTPTHGIRIEVGYKPAFRNFTDATNIDLGQNPTGWCYRNTAQWFYASVGYRYYFNRLKTIYFSPEVFFKTMEADDIVYMWGIYHGGSITNGFEIRSMNTKLWGINLLIGKKLRFKFSKGFNMGLDIFTGVSMRLKNIHTTIFGSTERTYGHDEFPVIVNIPYYETPEELDTHPFQVSPQFGIVLYVSWK